MFRKSFILFLIIVLASITILFSENYKSAVITEKNTDTSEISSKNRIHIIQNKGQWDNSIAYGIKSPDVSLFFQNNSLLYRFLRKIENPSKSKWIPDFAERYSHFLEPERNIYESSFMQVNYLNANTNPEIIADNPADYKCNYFLGNDPEKWQTNISSYQKLTYKDLYPGIDLVYESSAGNLEYELMVSPTADYRNIKIRYNGAESVKLNSSGNLELHTNWGQITETRPQFYQPDGRNEKALNGSFVILDDSTISFNISEKLNPELPLRIDPVIMYSTLLGGLAADFGWDAGFDIRGSAYISGYTASEDFPVVASGLTDTVYETDVFISKFSPSGDDLLYSTYIGSTKADRGYSLALDKNNNVFVTGWTSGSDFPVRNAYDGSYNGGLDVFVTKLSPFGDSIIFSTFLGGDKTDWGSSIVTDDYGNCYFTGRTESSDFPSVNSYDATLNGSFSDAFVSKFSPDGNDLLYSTYLGGTSADWGYSLCVDEEYNAYITGYTGSTDYPTVNAFNNSNSGDWDVFVSKLSPAGNSLVYSTYLGGGRTDWGYDIAVNKHDNAYVTGWTNSADFPVNNAISSIFKGESDVFVVKLSAGGSSLVYSSYLGGFGEDNGYGITVNNQDYAYLTGYTESPDFPTVNATDDSHNGGSDVFATRITPSGNSLNYSTFIGGSGDDRGFSIDLSPNNKAYIAGTTDSEDFPLINSGQSFSGSADVFLVKISGYDLACGDTNGDGIVDVSDAVYMLKFVFDTGFYPDPLYVSDVDCNSIVNIIDAVYMINYIFRDGSAPCEDCPY